MTDRFFTAAYYSVMTVYIGFAAYILADKFQSFFLNPAVQITGICGGFIALYFLWEHRPESGVKPERKHR